MPRLSPILTAALPLILITGGCGSDSGSEPKAPAPSPVTAVQVSGDRAEAGDTLAVTSTVRAGTGSDSGPGELTYYLSLDRKRGGDDVRLEGSAPLRGERIRGKARIPRSARAGAYRVLACAEGCTATKKRVIVAGTDDLPEGAERLIATGDIAHCPVSGDEATADLVDVLPGTIAALGDTVYEEGTVEEYQRCYEPGWGRHKDRTRPAIGNHEYGTGNADAYFAYFGEAAGPPGKGWYSYDLGAWHVVVLNSYCDVIGGCARDSEQVRWLEADLRKSKSACTLAYFHHPRFSSGGEHGSDDSVAPFWEVLHENDADVVLSGHDHHYERFSPQDPNGVLGTSGMREFVVGTGGKELYDVAEPEPNSEVRADDTHGVLEMILKPDGYDWRFLPAAGGDATDSGSDSCRTG